MNRMSFIVVMWFMVILTTASLGQNVMTIVTVAPNISPFISDWREDATMIYVRIDNVGGAGIERARLHVTVTGITYGLVIEANSLEFSIPENGSIILRGTDKLLDVKSVSFKGKTEKRIRATNRIDDDHYDICVDVIDLSSDEIISNSCAPFDIRAASAPVLLYPPDGEIITLKYPVFQWVPSRTTNKIEPRYSIQVRPLRQKQTPTQSLESATVEVFDKDNLTMPSVMLDTKAIELEDGQTYVWQVQARDRSGKPLGENDGKSEVFTFTYMSLETFHEMQDSLRATGDSELENKGDENK